LSTSEGKLCNSGKGGASKEGTPAALHPTTQHNTRPTARDTEAHSSNLNNGQGEEKKRRHDRVCRAKEEDGDEDVHDQTEEDRSESYGQMKEGEGAIREQTVE
jgi:hypothetical protein